MQIMLNTIEYLHYIHVSVDVNMWIRIIDLGDYFNLPANNKMPDVSILYQIKKKRFYEQIADI